MTGPEGFGDNADSPTEGAGVHALLRRLVAERCSVAADDIDPDRPLAEYGLSSRDAVGISGELEEALGRTLPATLLWENPSIGALVHRLTEDADQPLTSGGGGGSAGEDGPGPLAVVGVGCRLPGGIEGPDAFWDFLLCGGDAVGEVPPERWEDFDDGSAATAAALAKTPRWGAFLDDVAAFDAEFFGITPREAQLMDPQQRLLLEVACEALDNAGAPVRTLRGSATGVFVGLSSLEYGFLTTADPSRVTEWTATGSAGSIAANRLSYVLDLRGPSLTVDTACSSSLVALHQACRALRSGECDTALAAGVNVLLSPMITASFDQAGVLAPDGRCKPFDAAADGIVRGEGCGVLVLKRLDDALRDGDRILALIRGTAVNSDGRSAGMVAPNPAAQQALLRSALRDARVDGAGIDYVETHGTGTLLGDPIEAGALSAVLGPHRPPDRPLLIGSVKSNLGHLEGAAGITGVIKTVLSLHHGRLPASLHFHHPNPHIDFTEAHLAVVGEAAPWPGDGERPARAGVSAFGFGGTNAHAVLEQWKPEGAAPPAPAEDGAQRAAEDGTAKDPHTLVLSARSPDRIRDAATGLADWLTGPAGRRTPLEDVASTLGRNRHGPANAAVVGRDREALATALRALGQRQSAHGVVGARRGADPDRAVKGPVFVFSGYGSQWAGMGRRLLEDDEVFAAAVRGLDPVFAAESGTPLSEQITAGVEPTAVDRVQPLLYGLQLALARTWRAYGVEPAAVVGHSMGEVAAAVVADALDPRDGLRIMLRRSALLGAVDAENSGSMASVELDLEARAQVQARFPGVEIAVDSSPLRCTVTGPAEPVGRLVAELEEAEIPARMLDVGGAGHSPEVDPLLPGLREAFTGIHGRDPAIRWYGTVHDDPRDTPRCDADYWCDNARRPVRLRQAVAAAAEDGHHVFLEISPHPVAALPVRETLEEAVDRETLVLPSLRRKSDEQVVLRTSLAALHLAGVQRRPDLLWPGGRRTALPTTPWRHRRHWVDSGPGTRRSARVDGHPLLGGRVDVPGTRRSLWRGDVGTEGWYRPGQQVHGTTVLTVAACAEMVFAAAAEVFARAVDGITIHGLTLEHHLPLSGCTAVTTLLDPIPPERASVSIHTRTAAGTWVRHASATVETGAPYGPEAVDGPDDAGADNEGVTVALSPREEGAADFSVPWHVDPALLDACLRAPNAVTEPDPGTTAPGGATGEVAAAVPKAAIPVSVGTLRVRRPAAAPGPCHVRRTSPEGTGDEADRRGPTHWSVRLEDGDGATVIEADDVVLRVPEAREVPLPLHEMAYEIVWDKSAAPTPPEGAPSDWLLLTVGDGDDGGTGSGTGGGPRGGGGPGKDRFTDTLRAALEQAGARVTVAPHDPASADALTTWQERAADGAHAAVVLLFTESTGTTGAREAVLATADTARRLSDDSDRDEPPRLCLVTERAMAVSVGERGDPDRACLRGLVRVLALEHPHLRSRLVDIDRSPGAVDDLARELLGDSDADQVAWRGGTRFTARLARADLGKDAAQVVFARPGGAYIVTGGLSGLGLATARRLAEHGASRLVLNGRRPPTPGAETILAELRDLGTSVEIVRGDVAEPGVATALVEAAVREGHALRGVAHAAGVLHDRVVTGLEPEGLDTVFRPKVDGARRLDEATCGHDLDWWLVFSSAAALFGSPGQASYAAANAWLDALVQQRRARGLPGESIAWGPWAGLGAAPDMTALALHPIAPDEGLDALQLIIAGGRPHTGVVRLDVRRAVEAFPGIESVPFFADLVRGAAEDSDDDWGGPEALRTLDPEAALTAVRRRLGRRTAMVMGHGDQEIDASARLTELGLDSLMAVRIRNVVKQDFGTVVPETLLLRGGTLGDLAQALLTALDMHPKPRAAGPAIPRNVLPRDAAERLVAGVWAQMSGEHPEGVHRDLPGVRDDREKASALAEGIRARLGGTDSAPTVAQIQGDPTVAAVADLVRPVLEGGVAGSPLRVLRDPGDRAERGPLFIFHPAGGPTSVYRPLVDLLPEGRPVYGLERVDALESVEEKTAHYLDLMRRVQPEGPYRLLGWSFGGCLAYEAASQLRDLGERVAYLGLIDTILPAALPGPPPEEILLERFARFAEYVETAYGRQLGLPYEEMARMNEHDQIETLMRHVAEAGLDMSPGVMEHQRTSYTDARIGERYQPRPYAEPVVLYRAQEAQVLTTAIDPRYLRAEADLGWAPLCPALEVVPVPGDHLSMIDPPNVEVMARHLAAAVDEHP
ncbi:type I polyketide synthase [Wenjunlia tyrosinilytica]|uniref:Phthiocerol/phenolphthiocerol synthesis polyketide synthase type I PpsD n=1 Tax=Wenjunlia tyrosinilytica TaxID=1544741 RepID=A0A917ZSV9_9ACTN|nr:type I polyketide synthase [Wenjunlia tyrosinilytica]GGO89797.1 phthiocerol/phenolphthiocerol synthesis polyketide synthase type I PpsD [Wenjunlia tyrosinilytica]